MSCCNCNESVRHRHLILAEVRHERVRRGAKSFRISSGSRRVYTTFAVEFEALREDEAELLEKRFLLCRGFCNTVQADLAAVCGRQDDISTLQSGEQSECLDCR